MCTTDWIAKIIEDKNMLLKKCEDIFSVIVDKTDILDFLWNHVWEQVKQISVHVLNITCLKCIIIILFIGKYLLL